MDNRRTRESHQRTGDHMKMKIVKIEEHDNVVTLDPQEIEETDITALRRKENGSFEAYMKGIEGKIRFRVPKEELERLIARDRT
jgi:hypothetical protein